MSHREVSVDELESPAAHVGESPHPNGVKDTAHRLMVVGLRRQWLAWIRRIALGVSGFLLFYLALGVMKAGSGSLEPFIRGGLAITNVADSLGLGWLMAYLAQSGSPVAAVAVAMLSAATLTPPQAAGGVPLCLARA
jgi:hypothetical protein